MDVMKRFKYSMLLFCSISLVGCFESSTSGDTISRLIDNPTDKEIKVSIDGNELVIPAKSSVKHTFEYGKHLLTYNGQSINFLAKPATSSNTGFINPTQSNYYMLRTYYTKSQTDYDKRIKDDLNIFQVTINGKPEEVELPIKIINDIFIEKNYAKYVNAWDYGINDKLPDEIRSKKTKKKDKLFREAEFIEYLAQSDEELKTLQFPNQPKKYADLTQYVVPNINLADIKCDEGREFVKQHLTDWNNLFTLKGEDLTKLYSKITSKDTFREKRSIMERCTAENDPNHTYMSATREIESALKNTEQINLFIIE